MTWLIPLLFLSMGQESVEAKMLGYKFKARYAIASGDYERALKQVDGALALEQNADMAYLKVDILTQLNARSALAAQQNQKRFFQHVTEYMKTYPDDHRFPQTLGIYLVKELVLARDIKLEKPEVYLKRSLSLMADHTEYKSQRSDAWYYLGHWYSREEREYEAAEAFRQVTLLEPGESWALYYTARALEQSHQLNKALDYYQRYLNVGDVDPITQDVPVPVSVHLIKVFITEEADGALQELLDFMAVIDAEVELYLRIAQRLQSIARHDEALTMLRAIPEEKRDVTWGRLMVNGMQQSHDYAGLAEEMIKISTRMKSRRERLFVLETLVEANLLAGQYKQALDHADQMPQLGQSMKLDLYKLFAALLAGEDIAPRQKDLEVHNAQSIRNIAHESDPNEIASVVHRHLMQLYMGHQNWDGALEQYRAAVKVESAGEPGDDLAVIYYLSGQIEKSFALYEELLAANPDRVDFMNNYAYFLCEENQQLERAHELLTKVLKVSDNSAYLDSMGWVLFKMGRLDEAETYIKQALLHEGEGDDPEKLEHLGDIYFAQGKLDDARRTWSKAMDRASDRYFILFKKLDPHE